MMFIKISIALLSLVITTMQVAEAALGDNNRVHGYNPKYRASSGPFASFDLDSRGNPTAFKNQVVQGTTALDHQGHIISQASLGRVLTPVAQEMGNLTTEQQAIDYINSHVTQHPWLKKIYDYGVSTGVPELFDTDESGINKVRNLFSIAIWNPINICRAPEDNKRNGKPGSAPDDEVITYLGTVPGVNQTWLRAAQTMAAQPDDPNQQNLSVIRDYIIACSDTLAGQLSAGAGYYQFPWHTNSQNALVPGSQGEDEVVLVSDN